MGDVRKITKEKTAKIIPNAIGISTAEEKHTFGSLMNRDVVYRLVVSIWKKFHFPNGGPSDVDCVDGERVGLIVFLFCCIFIMYSFIHSFVVVFFSKGK